MDRMQAELEPLLEVIRYHIPPVWLDNALAGAVAVGVVGLVLALWGGRVFRPALVLVFAAGGVWVGLAGNQWLGLGQWFCLISGVLVFGALGFVLYRLWVGLGWSVLLVCVGLSVLGYRQALPHWGAFDSSRLSEAVLAEVPFQPPTVETQASFNQPDPAQVLGEFGAYLAENVPHIRRNAILVIGLVGMVGLLMGLLAVKFTVVLASSMVGVSLLGGALGYGLQRLRPEVLEQIVGRPAAVWAGLGIAALLCMAIQWFQVRPRVTQATATKSAKS